jgi:hypothetical protein
VPKIAAEIAAEQSAIAAEGSYPSIPASLVASIRRGYAAIEGKDEIFRRK